MGSYTLGLDIGSKSIGWALLTDGKKPSIAAIGVRVFPEGVDRDTKGAEKSKNATRREARGTRRIHKRRNLRRDELAKRLREAGLLPNDEQELQELLKKDPYQLRARGLDEKLELCEFGRVLFHINQRRGFKSNRKTGRAKEDGKVAKAAGELQQKINEAACRTLGEYFASLNPEENRIREQYTFRQMYEKEFDRLWEKQAEFYPEIFTENLRNKIRNEIIFYQRPLKPTDDLIGDCDLEKGEKRCPRGDWYARRFRLLQDINNLKICSPEGNENALKDQQKATILGELLNKKEVSFSSLRKKLGLLETYEFNAEYEVNDKGKKNDKLKGDEFNASMRNKKVFGPKVWDAMKEAEKIKLNGWLVELDDDELIEKLVGEYGLTDEQREAVLKISLPQGYMRFSRKAIHKLFPLMESGKRTDEALDKIYPDRIKREEWGTKDKLDLPEDLRNPIVNKALFEVRKVVNAIVREYGKSKQIKIEMARDVQGSIKQRKQIHWKMFENKKENKRVRQRLIEDIKKNPTRDDIIRYNLWEECGHTCVYTGKHISQAALFGPNPEFQVEHILPYDRSLDDSYMNKTLCDVHENIHVKKGQTPYEAYSADAEKYEQILQRVNNSTMPYWKRRKFWQKEIETDKIIERELNDTRYICREAVRYLRQVCKNVTGTRGKITGELQYQWGLIKDRDDHRHHAIDAAVVAVTEQRHLRELGRTKYSVEGIKFSPPWQHFREEVEEKVRHINVSHRASRKVSGALHEETSYGITGEKDEKGQDIFVYRKKLEDLTGPMVAKIVDGIVKQIVRERLAEHNIDPNKTKKIPKEVWNEPLYTKTTKSDKKVPIKKVRIHSPFDNMILLNDKSGKPYRAVAPGSNHHIEIFEYTEGKKKGKRDGEVVTMFEAVRRKCSGESVIKKDHGSDKKFICSLSINEMFMLELDDGLMGLHRVQKITQSGNNISIIFRPHTYAGKVSDYDKPPLIQRRSPNTLKGHKVTVDMLGRIHMAND